MSTTFIYGLYSTSDINNVRYVGKTVQRLSKRLYEHIHDTKNSYKINWIKKEISNGHTIKIKVIDEVYTEDWEFWEMFWIQEYFRRGFKLTNLAPGDKSPSNTCEVYSLTLSGIIDKKFKTFGEAARFYNINESSISDVSRTDSKRRTSGGHIFIKVDDYNSDFNYSYLKRKTRAKQVHQYSLNGSYLNSWDSATLARAHYNGVNISACISGAQKQSCGFRWSYDKLSCMENITKKEDLGYLINVYKNENLILAEVTTLEAAKNLKINRKKIYDVLSGRRKTTGGYNFTKVEYMLNNTLHHN